MTRTRMVAVGAFALYVVAVKYNVLAVLLRMEPPHWILAANALTFFVFAIAHASDRLGTRAMLVFLGITFVVSLIFETIGVLTGLIYGPYYYTNKLGAMLGVVPLLIPVAWFMMMYASYTIVEVIAGETQRQAWLWSAWLALVGAMVMTAWDLGMDPQMAAAGHWVWTQGGGYFGIPVRNFIGWLATTFTVFFLFRVYQTTQSLRTPQFNDGFALLPVAAYAVQGFATIVVNISIDQRAIALITFFSMGAFLFVALTRWMRERIGVNPEARL